MTWSFAFLWSVETLRDLTRVNIFVVNVLVRMCFLFVCVGVCGGGGGGRGWDSVFGMNLASYVNSVVKIDSTLSYVIPY